ncbi:MAG TPA: LysR substrate-binding domain-containing protein [Geminicoccaceae bacterium]|nr:LysR substrate-binding domain-containing protein [Geminicoccus sp.]HMU51902.1 LysR substrate-binding domain-containing protein [Geminicoccaceae bacterium]
MHLRHLHYLVVLARERHFGRAAAACHVTQSTLSAAIRQLEEEVAAPLIQRDRRFRGLTPEGEALLAWARRILGERAALDQHLDLLRQGLAGQLRLGVIPVALPVVALLTTPFNRAHPAVTLTIASRTSAGIQRGLDEFELDAGLTYLDNEPLRGVRAIPLYTERYILLTPTRGPFAGRRRVTWAEAGRVPLCLLTGDMQNRRILDGIFREAGTQPRPHVETNSIMTLCSHIRAGAWSSVMPHSLLWVLGTPQGMMALPLEEPVRTHGIGLVARDSLPVPPLVGSLEETARGLAIQQIIDAIGTD